MMKLGYSQVKHNSMHSTSHIARAFAAVAGLLASAPLIARADERPVAVARNDATSQATSARVDTSKLPRVSLVEIRRLDTESRKYKIDKLSGETSSGYGESYGVPLETGGRLFASVSICPSDKNCGKGPNKYADIYAQGVPGIKKEHALGTLISVVDLTELDAYYKLRTGKEMRYARLVIEKGVDPEVGNYTQITVVPVENPTAEIQDGVQVIGRAFYQGKMHKSDTPSLVAMR